MDERSRLALLDMVEHAEEALQHLAGIRLKDFQGDLLRRRAVERTLEIIGEAAKRVATEVRAEIDLPWRRIIGLRVVLAHQYGHVRPEEVYRVARDRLPGLIETLRSALGRVP